jgi:hypothetical protein
MLLDKALGIYWGGAATGQESSTVNAEGAQMQDQGDVGGGEGRGERGGDPVVSSPPTGAGTGGGVDGSNGPGENAGDGRGCDRGVAAIEEVRVDVDQGGGEDTVDSGVI